MQEKPNENTKISIIRNQSSETAKGGRKMNQKIDGGNVEDQRWPGKQLETKSARGKQSTS